MKHRVEGGSICEYNAFEPLIVFTLFRENTIFLQFF